MVARMDHRKYVSMSRERKLGLAAADSDPEQNGGQSYASFKYYTVDTHIESSLERGNGLFAAQMPGVMSPEEITDFVPASELIIMYQRKMFALSVSSFLAHNAFRHCRILYY